MGIVKVRKDVHDNHGDQSSFDPAVDEFEERERTLQENDPADDSDGECELFPKAGCELVKIGDQKCSVPYDLYDLTDLKEVFSLETWNSCLSEEERFSLSAYLPDMDEETFWLTMKELLGGENVFFGSPLEVFFRRLKGGFCSPKVAQFQEALQCIQKRCYYHSLRLYHENMVRTFMDMKEEWTDCQPSIDVEERVRIWNKRRAPKPVCVVDLNAFPADDEILTGSDKNVSSTPLSKKMKFADDRVMDSHASVPLTSTAALSLNSLPKTKPRGVLKIKSTSKNLESSSTMQSLPCDSWGKLRPPPKGVLKIKPRSEPLSKQDRPGELSLTREAISVEASGLQPFRFSPQHPASTWDMDNVYEELPFPHQKVIGGRFNGSPELPPLVKGLPRGQVLKTNRGSFNNLQNFERRKVRKVGFHKEAEVHCLPGKDFQKPEIYSDDVADQMAENLGQHSGPWAMGLYPPTELDPSALLHCQGGRRPPSLSSVAIPRASAVGAEETGSFGKSFDHLELRHKNINGKGLLKPSDQPSIAGFSQGGFMLPLTYKRKKGHSKHKSLEHVQQPIEKMNAETTQTRMPNGSDSHLVEEAKSMKIKLKMWSGPDTQYKQGLLNGL